MHLGYTSKHVLYQPGGNNQHTKWCLNIHCPEDYVTLYTESKLTDYYTALYTG